MKPLAAIAGFCLLAAVYVLAPHRMRGEQPDAELRGTGAPLCARCPWEQQITGVGLERAGETAWLTVRFAAPPSAARLSLVLGAAARRVTLQQPSAERWTLSTTAGSDVPLDAFRVAMRGDRIVWAMPAAIAGKGIAVASAERRFPADGLLLPSAPGPPRLNVVDLLVALVLVVGALIGWRRGAAGAAWQLLACLGALVIARALFGPMGRLLGTASDVMTPAIYVAALAAAAAIVWLTARILRGPLTRLVQGANRDVYPAARVVCAAALGVGWATAVAAMAVSFGSELVALDWAHRAIQASPTAQMLIGGWNLLFPPLV